MSDPRVLTGLGVSPGYVVGRAYVIPWGLPDVPHRVISPAEVTSEVDRLQGAVDAVRRHVETFRERTAERAGPAEAKIFDAQILMLQDVELMSDVERLIRENQLSAERAYEFKSLEVRALWAQSSSPVLRQRRADLAGISVRVLHQLLGHSLDDFLDREDEPVIVFTQQLTPDLTVEFDREQVVGFASVRGTRTSHAAILAHSLGIPCVMGLVGGLEKIEHGMSVILDGTHGTVLLEPSVEEVAEANAKEQRFQALERELEQVVGQPGVTADGVSISLRGNVDLPEELNQAVEHGAEGVGLVRTEFLVVGRTELPQEDEQARYFERVALRFPDHPVVIRSYDLGGDTFPAPFRAPGEANPFLGWRAIRVCLDQPDLLRTQARAVLRARAAGDVQLMLPLITQVEELAAAREIAEQAREELVQEGVRAASDLPVGVMIETPAAVYLAEELAKRSDFLSVGTNDLTQYVLAVDRSNARLAHRFTPFHPAVVRALKVIADAGIREGRPVSVCGEMASEPLAVFLLLGLGYRVLSVSPPRLPLVRWLIRQIDVGAAKQAGESVLHAATTQEITAILTEGIVEFIDLGLLEAGQLPAARAQTTLNS
jgi:phosphotransferase system enzyme I (PtsI)